MREITPKTKVDDLLNDYPELEEFLMRLNPKYKKLKNPVLRRTVAKIATLTQVAKIGGYDPVKLVNMLRKEVGEAPLESGAQESEEESKEAPLWLQNPPKKVLDVTKLLDEEKNPLAEATKALRELKSGETLLLKSDFLPAPLIETFKEKGLEVYSSETDDGEFLTYIYYRTD